MSKRRNHATPGIARCETQERLMRKSVQMVCVLAALSVAACSGGQQGDGKGNPPKGDQVQGQQPKGPEPYTINALCKERKADPKAFALKYKDKRVQVVGRFMFCKGGELGLKDQARLDEAGEGMAVCKLRKGEEDKITSLLKDSAGHPIGDAVVEGVLGPIGIGGKGVIDLVDSTVISAKRRNN
jgi:hypothetical protein